MSRILVLFPLKKEVFLTRYQTFAQQTVLWFHFLFFICSCMGPGMTIFLKTLISLNLQNLCPIHCIECRWRNVVIISEYPIVWEPLNPSQCQCVPSYLKRAGKWGHNRHFKRISKKENDNFPHQSAGCISSRWSSTALSRMARGLWLTVLTRPSMPSQALMVLASRIFSMPFVSYWE